MKSILQETVDDLSQPIAGGAHCQASVDRYLHGDPRVPLAKRVSDRCHDLHERQRYDLPLTCFIQQAAALGELAQVVELLLDSKKGAARAVVHLPSRTARRTVRTWALSEPMDRFNW
ncbi:MAG: hypothetical protein R3B70_35375 [Polyangiaceae bacterium]